MIRSRMRVMALGPVALALAACSPQSLKTQWDWRSFTADPSEAHFEAVKADLAECSKPGCEALSSLTDADIDGLSARIDSAHPDAIRFGMWVHPLLVDRGQAVTRLEQRYGVLATADARIFLAAAKAKNCSDAALVTAVSTAVLENPSAEEAELDKRRDALEAVNDPDLLAVRDACVAAVDKAWEKADSGFIYVRPVAAAVPDRPHPSDPANIHLAPVDPSRQVAPPAAPASSTPPSSAQDAVPSQVPSDAPSTPASDTTSSPPPSDPPSP